eukprot:CAMPEP_0172550238 /NCGR_PEP_ID=MMETSP1067-20121228/27283_1 /TAXON_ID=265564 ORGANISM="Thalassiosira punctigera, Strain Tpunct2005C2" /NCGR_SAMPLE_ID=MMETSP1067 /ASSEMBLY_ACC=CAM_ASM_000444 /LENGTH=523 /DNA_ID=CAMNT_0013337753 /DNA_START=33 /DNA_END=1604 /DNA_ORIENTATION=-
MAMASATTLLQTMMLATIICCIVAATSADRVFPQRTSKEAAVIEWGHSAIISALDGAVATFGPQTSQGANFEVETAPVLASPIDGVGKKKTTDDGSSTPNDLELPKLLNADAVEGNMVIMTDAAGLSGVAMAKIAKESGAAALMVVNTDQNAGDYIYSLEPETDEEAAYAEDNIDIPVIMVSLQAGNVITTAMADDDTPAEVVNSGRALPDRVRLYAGGDRPFFEDAVSKSPVVYLIHNMLTEEECDDLIGMARGKYDRVDDASGVNNYLENTMASDKPGVATARNVDRVTLWKGGLAGKLIKDIDERISQVTGFPQEHFSDFQINKFTEGSSHEPHYDINPANGIMATITIFLNDVPQVDGGEFIFPNPEDGDEPVVVLPTRGLAIVHHNTDEKYNFDKATVHREATLSGGVKYVAKKFVYLNPQQNHARIVLPLLAMPFGGKLPRAFVTLQNVLIERYGMESGEIYFQKIVTMIPVLVLIGIASAVSNFITNKLKKDEEGKKGDESDGKSKKSKAKSKKSD